MLYLLQLKAFLKLFIKLFEFRGKSSANNSNNSNIENLIQEDSEISYNQYILFKIVSAACHESGFWRVHLSARLQQRACKTRYFIT